MKNTTENQEIVKETIIINNIHHAPQVPLWNPGIAAFLSFLFPGAGQIYRGKITAGIIWIITTLIGYMLFIFPGIILHIICIGMAATGDVYKKR